MNQRQLAENLAVLKNYAENQGDKFHPLSDSVLEVFGQHVPPNGDAISSISDIDVLELKGELESIVDEYAGNPESPYHQYHVDRIHGILEYEEED